MYAITVQKEDGRGAAADAPGEHGACTYAYFTVGGVLVVCGGRCRYLSKESGRAR